MIDRHGVVRTEFRYDYIASYEEGLSLVSLNNKWGFTDRSGKEIIRGFKFEVQFPVLERIE